MSELEYALGFAFLTLAGATHSPLFSLKIVEIERFALRAAILHECQNYLGVGGGLGGRAIIPDARPLGTFANQDGRH